MKYWLSDFSFCIQIGIVIGALLGSFFYVQSVPIILTIPLVLLVYSLWQEMRLWYLITTLISLISMGSWLNTIRSDYQATQANLPAAIQDIPVIIQSQPKAQAFGWQYQVFVPGHQARALLTIADQDLLYDQKILIQVGKNNLPNQAGISRFLLANQIHSYITAPKYELLASPCSWSCQFVRHLYRFRNWVLAKIDTAYPGRVGEFLKGILVGYTDSLPTEMEESFRITGVSHILAVSGYNMSIIISLVYQQLINRQISRKLAFGVTILSIVSFMLLTGGQASIWRAGVFAILILSAEQLRGYVSGFRPLLLCACLLSLFNPLYIAYDIGFQFSFLAVIGLLVYSYTFQSYGQGIPSLGLKDMILETIFAQILVLPLLIYYFEQVSLVSILANLTLVPFLPLAMLWGSLTSLIGPIPLLTYPLQLGLNSLLSLNSYLASLSWASVTISGLPAWLILASYLVLIGIWYSYKRWRKI